MNPMNVTAVYAKLHEFNYFIQMKGYPFTMDDGDLDYIYANLHWHVLYNLPWLSVDDGLFEKLYDVYIDLLYHLQYRNTGGISHKSVLQFLFDERVGVLNALRQTGVKVCYEDRLAKKPTAHLRAIDECIRRIKPDAEDEIRFEKEQEREKEKQKDSNVVPIKS